MPAPSVYQVASHSGTRSRVRISYCDASGDSSRRVIKPLRIFSGRYGETYVRAFCHLRGEERTFRLDRIRSWEVLGRGEEALRPAEGQLEARHPAAATPADTAAPAPQPDANRSCFPPGPRPRARPRAGRVVRRLLVWALVLYVGGRWLCEGTAPGESLGDLAAAVAGLFEPPAPRPTPAPAPKPPTPRKTPSPAPKAATRPAPAPQPPAPAPPTYTTVTYRGTAIAGLIQAGRGAWKIASLDATFSSLWEAQAAISAAAFRRATGIDSPELLGLYALADANRDGELGWKELQRFQRKLHDSYAYRSNPCALRPDEFLQSGGGDCEDWALVTCGLLRFWGRRAWVGSFGPSPTAVGHAVCLVPMSTVPPGMSWCQLQGFRTCEGEPIPDGLYVPVDYELVGGLTNAVEEGWELRRFFVPESIYGRPM